MNNIRVIDDFSHAIQEMLNHKLRTGLTLLGMVFGVGAVIAMLSISEGAKQEALQMIQTMGVRNLIIQNRVFDQDTLREMREDSSGLTLSDLRAASASLPFVTAQSAEKKVDTHTLFSVNNNSDASVLGVSSSHFALSNITLSDGEVFDQKTENMRSQVAVIGAQTAIELFPGQSALGQLIKINHLWFEVIGVLEDRHLQKKEFEGVRLDDERNRVFIPISTALMRFQVDELNSPLDKIKIEVAEGISPQGAAKALGALIEKRHGFIEDYDLIIPAALMKQAEKTQQIFTIVMSCIAGISLLVGGIGIMNIMLATVLERTPEIGLLRAIGATKADIKRQFLIESLTVSTVGAIIGVIFGVLLSILIQNLAGWTVAWSLLSVVIAVAVCLLVGVGFGLYPANKAAELDPIRALQSG